MMVVREWCFGRVLVLGEENEENLLNEKGISALDRNLLRLRPPSVIAASAIM